MTFKIITLILLALMVLSLGFGLYHLLKTPSERDQGDKVIKALTWRIGIWVVLFGFIVLSVKLGWIEPSNSVHPENFKQEKLEQIK